MKEVIANSYKEYRDIIEKYNKDNNLPRNTERGLLQTFYRGQSNRKWEIEPSIKRVTKEENKIISEEKNYIGESLFQIITRIQHYKTGTRLIDFTKSEDVALYFACSQEDKDGAVYVQHMVPHKEEWYTVHILLELSKLGKKKVKVRELTDILWSKYELFSKRFGDKNEVDMVITALVDCGIMIIPEKNTVMKNERLRIQNGCLWICGNKIEDNNQIRTDNTSGNMYIYPHIYCVPEFFTNHRDLLKIIIPQNKKKEFIQNLLGKNISEQSLFPDLIE